MVMHVATYIATLLIFDNGGGLVHASYAPSYIAII